MTIDEIIRETLMLPADSPISDELGPGQIPQWDSLGHVRLMSAIETAFSITIGMDEMIGIMSVADIRRLLKDKGVIEG